MKGMHLLVAAASAVCLTIAGPTRAQDSLPAAPRDSAAAAAQPIPKPSPGAPSPGAAPASVAPPAVTPSAAGPATPADRPLWSVPPGARAARTSGMCGVCHSDVRVKFDKGIHKTEEIGCISCHGGDPNATTVAAAHRGHGYRGRPRRRDIPALCASCHSDVARMRPYNLPSDQYALYKTSRHGIALAKGDESVAVCTDCHGQHEIRPRDDPQSRVARRNIPATCGHCHGDTTLMQRHGIKQNAFADYKSGIHGRALLLEGNDAAPECANCHGSHGAGPPGFGDVDKVCGQCHAKTRTFFLASAHRGSIESGGRSECAACHHNHKTVEPSPKSFDLVCSECHDAGTPEAHVAGRVKTMLATASAEIDRAHRMVQKAAAIPLYVEDYESRLEDARTALLEMGPVTHSLDTTLVEPHARRARSIASEVSHEIDEKLAGRWWRYVGLGLFWFYLLLTAAIVTRARRTAAAERDR